MASTDRVIRLIVHTKAAGSPELRQAVEAVRADGHRVEVRVTWDPGDAKLFAREARRDGIQTVVAAGGDGTLNAIINGLYEPGQPLPSSVGVLPLGTANDFATACRIPLGDPEAALRLIATTPPTPIDLARMNERVYLNVASGGFATDVTANTSEDMKQLLGGVAYLLTGLFSLSSIHARHVRARGPGFDWDGDLYVLAVGNGRQAGGGFRLCDRALLDDGLLDVFVLPDVPFDRVMDLLGDLLSTDSHDYAEAVYHQVPWLEVEAPGGMQINLDGEPHRGERFRFESLPGAVPFHLPRDAPLLRNRPGRG